MRSASIIKDILAWRTPADSSRVRITPPGRATGQVDGAWWPRSRDLADELPVLLAALQGRSGPAEQVSYHLGDWEPADRKIQVEGAVVRLSGFRFQRCDTVEVLGARERVTVLVLPPETPAQRAHDALTAAAHPGNTDDVATLLNPQSHSPVDEEISR